MKEWSEVEESCAADALWDDDRMEELEEEQRDEENTEPLCVVEGCDNEGTLEFMGEYVCSGHLAEFTDSCYDRMIEKEDADVR